MLTLRRPGRGLVVGSDEEVAADQLPLRARLAVRSHNPVAPIVAHGLLIARRVRAALLLSWQHGDEPDQALPPPFAPS